MCHHRFPVFAIMLASAVVCCCTGLSAQTNERDSLLRLLPLQAQDTNRAKTYYHLAKYYEKNDLDSATLFLQLLEKLAKTLSYDRGRYLYYERMAVVSFTR